MVVGCGMSTPHSLTRGDNIGIARQQTIPLDVMRTTRNHWKSISSEARLSRVAHRMQGCEVPRLARPATGVGDNMISLRRKRPIDGMDGAATIVGVVRQLVREHVADCDKDAARDRPATAIRADEAVAKEDFRPCAIRDRALLRRERMPREGSTPVRRSALRLSSAYRGSQLPRALPETLHGPQRSRRSPGPFRRGFAESRSPSCAGAYEGDPTSHSAKRRARANCSRYPQIPAH